MLAVSVKGGTHAGWRRVREGVKGIWRCSRGHENPGYRRHCWTCHETRPR